MAFSLAQLRHFIALAENGSFTGGAGAAGRSQAAFSRSIAMLEQGLDVQLVDRIGHNNELTPIGALVLEHARHIVAEADELEQAVQVRAHFGASRFRLGLSPTPHALLTDQLLAFAARQQPTLKVLITSGSIELQVLALRERKLDALIVDVRAVPPHQDLVVEHLADLEIAFLCRAGHPLAGRRSVQFSDVIQHPVACTAVSDEMTRMVIKAFGSDAHPSSMVTLCCEDLRSLLTVTRTTDAVYLGVAAPARALLDQGEVVCLPLDTSGLDASFGLVRLAGRSEPPAMLMLRDLVREVLQR